MARHQHGLEPLVHMEALLHFDGIRMFITRAVVTVDLMVWHILSCVARYNTLWPSL